MSPHPNDPDFDLVKATLWRLGHLEDPERYIAVPSTPEMLRRTCFTKAGWVRQVIGAIRAAGYTIIPSTHDDPGPTNR